MKPAVAHRILRYSLQRIHQSTRPPTFLIVHRPSHLHSRSDDSRRSRPGRLRSRRRSTQRRQSMRSRSIPTHAPRRDDNLWSSSGERRIGRRRQRIALRIRDHSGGCRSVLDWVASWEFIEVYNAFESIQFEIQGKREGVNW
jgi:hypothetical protein